MEFTSYRRESVMLNPLKEMAPRSIPSEIRLDPLTGRSSRICHFMRLHWEKPDFERMVAGTEATCPFCGEKVTSITPCFPDHIVAEGRMVSGDMVLFPNIAPYDSLGAVATLGADHYVPMTRLGVRRIAGGLGLARDFFRRVHDAGHPQSVYHIVNWNYMPPSGSSLIHPHLQVFATDFAPYLMRLELEAAKAYQSRTGHNYWDDLVASEIATEQRFLGLIGRTAWFSAFAPMGVAGDVLCVVKDARCTLDLTQQDLADIARGLTCAMDAYDKMGIYSFNMNFFTGTAEDDHSRFHLLFSPRTFFNQALGTPDVGALRNLFNETLCMAFPEDIAEALRPSFSA